LTNVGASEVRRGWLGPVALAHGDGLFERAATCERLPGPPVALPDAAPSEHLKGVTACRRGAL